MTPEQFIERYERALASQRWGEVEPLVHGDVCVTFSTGAVHRGKEAVRAAFERNFAAIRGEVYRMTEVHWVVRTEEVAVYVFRFDWSGVISGRRCEGGGRGTGVLVREGGGWKMVAEHLGAGAVEEAL